MQGGSSIFDQDLGEGDGHMLFTLQGGPHGSAHVKDEQVQRFAYPGAHHPPTQTDLRMCSGGAGVAGGLDPTAAGVHNTPAGYFGSPSPLYGFGQSNGFAHPVAQHPSTHHDLHACSGGAGVAGGLDPTAAGVHNTPAGYFGSPPPLYGFGQPNGFGALNYPTGDMVAMHAAMQEVQRNHAMQRANGDANGDANANGSPIVPCVTRCATDASARTNKAWCATVRRISAVVTAAAAAAADAPAIGWVGTEPVVFAPDVCEFSHAVWFRRIQFA